MIKEKGRFKQYVEALRKDFGGQVLERAGMKRYTTFKIGGMAAVMVWPETVSDLEVAIDTARRLEAPWRILGAGSNILVGDAGVSEVLIALGESFSGDKKEGSGENAAETAAVRRSEDGFPLMRLDSGVRMAKAVKQCQVLGLCGLEWAAAIPGSVGGAVVMNAGFREGSMSSSLESVKFFEPGEGMTTVAAGDLDFEYRGLKSPPGAVVVSCDVRLTDDDPRAIRERIVKSLKWRRQHQPLTHPSAGSVFKNPTQDHAGRLIEAAGLKGERVGDAQISDLHANFIVNRGRARSKDVLKLIELARERVSNEFGVELELEIEVIGEELP